VGEPWGQVLPGQRKERKATSQLTPLEALFKRCSAKELPATEGCGQPLILPWVISLALHLGRARLSGRRRLGLCARLSPVKWGRSLVLASGACEEQRDMEKGCFGVSTH
jgi:hypothetical protein